MRSPCAAFPTRSFLTAACSWIFLSLVAVPFAIAAAPPSRRSPAQDKPSRARPAQPWMLAAPLPSARWGAAGATVDGCRLLVIGGSDLTVLDENLVYDPATDVWNPRAPMPAPRTGITGATAGEFVVVAGGYSPRSWGGVGIADDTFAYNTAANTWITLAPLPTPIATGAMAAARGRLYMIGGDDGDGVSNDTNFEYDPSTDSWASRAPMPTPRENFVAVTLRNRIFVAGGVDVSDPDLNGLNAFEMYDPATDTWTTRAPMLEGRAWPGIATDGRSIIVYGGASSYQAADAHSLSSGERYDPATDAWTPIPAMEVPADGAATAYVAGRLYSAGGETFDSVDFTVLDTNQFLPIRPNPCTN